MKTIGFTSNSSYRSYQRFEHINEAKGSFSIVLTQKPSLHVAVNKGGFARGRNCNNSYCVSHWRIYLFI